HAASDGHGDIYAWFWYALAESRLGKPLPRRGVPDYDEKKWPAAIVTLYQGKSSPDALLAAAAAGEDAEQTGVQLCEADFFAGEWLLAQHDAAAGKPLIQKAAQGCTRRSMAWIAAQMEIAGLP